MIKYIFFYLLFFIQTLAFSQAIATSSGISVQGLLKDTTGTPLSNVIGASLNFTLYYLDSDSNITTITSIQDEVNTDDYGVFSYVLNVGSSEFEDLAFYQSYMRIDNGTQQIFNQKLYSVPYAIHARNGYPVGTILPYLGDELPSGWLFCNGESIPNDIFHSNLIALVGENTPNLSGVFLRGTGTQGSLVNYYEWGYNSQGNQTTYSGPDLMTFQNDAMSRHSHSSGTIALSEAGRHIHPVRADGVSPNGTNTTRDGQSVVGTSNSDEGMYEFTDETWRPIDYAGEHTHNLGGNTGIRGNGNEVRPVNYGVNYIIKI